MDFVDHIARVESDTRSLGFLSRNLVGQRFEFSIRSIKLQDTDLLEVMGEIGGVRRSNQPFEVQLPIFSESVVNTKNAAEAKSIGNFSLNISNSTDLKVGSFFKFSGHTKCYQISKITGANIEFYPNLVRPVVFNEVLIFNNVPFTVKIKGRPQKYNITADSNSAIVELNLIEIV